jgi:hypothetical protein
VEAICRDLQFEFSGLHVPEHESDNYSLAYGAFVPLLVKAIQELSAETQQLRETVAQQAALLNELRAEVRRMLPDDHPENP